MDSTSGDAVDHANVFALAANRQLLEDEEDEPPSSDDDESTPLIPYAVPVTHHTLFYPSSISGRTNPSHTTLVNLLLDCHI